MDKFIHFLIKYNDKIIFASGAAICLLAALVVWWQIFGKKEESTSASSDIDFNRIEETLKKILAQTNSAIANLPPDAAAGSGAVPAAQVKITDVTSLEGQPITDVPGIKSELEKRARTIQELRDQVSSAKQSDSSDLVNKIKDLEARLAEYAIIEDDIADLSKFKEENENLKKQLESLKRAGPEALDQFAEQAATPAAPAAPEPAPAVAATPTPEPSPVAVAAPEPAPTPTPEPAPAATPAPEPAPVAAPVAASDAAPKAADPSVKPPDPTDVLGEFQGQTEGIDPLAELGDIDPDKMLNELIDLNSEGSASDLEAAPDIDKMANEAGSLSEKKA